jgi:hypothetical protein
MVAELGRASQAAAAGSAGGANATLDPKDAELLRDLGYIDD